MNLEQQRAIAIAQARRRRAEAEQSAIPPEDRRDSRGVPGGPDITPTLTPSFGERAIDASAAVLGAPVDAVNNVLSAVGLPTSETPFMGNSLPKELGNRFNSLHPLFRRLCSSSL